MVFDVDSTISPDEAIDVLAGVAGVGDAVAALTREAMGGSVTFQDAIAARLKLIRPTPALIARCLAEHPPRLTPGIAELVAALHRRGTAVFLVSGGFEPFIHPLADRLSIARTRVHANAFTADGACDPTRPTSRSGGKGVVVQRIRDVVGAPTVMIGDGATDLEARPPADLFIGFGGIIARDRIQREADWFVREFATLTEALS